MDKVRLGKTNLMVTRTSFGALPIQRLTIDDASAILRRAYEAGINFFDTARYYTDSEEKMGHALSDVREDIIIATKSGARDRDGVLTELDTSLKNLRTDYVDILQLHNPPAVPDPDDAQSAYRALMEAKEQGMIRHLGITNHHRGVAHEAIESGLFETLQFPCSTLSSDEELALVDLCKAHNVGFIAMKALSGGLLTDARTAFAFLRQFENVVPIWGIQRLEELEEILALDAAPPELDDAMRETIARDRDELSGAFCRGCGYCLPCPEEIPIPMAARMGLILRRAPYQSFITDEWAARMDRITHCTECRQCAARCPYELDIPKLLKENLADFIEFRRTHSAE